MIPTAVSKNTFLRLTSLLLILSICLSFGACSQETQGKIYLYGESHGDPDIMNAELELWQEHYHERGMRHLFVEYSYYTAAFLNLWMRAEDETILLEIYADWEGTQAQTEAQLDFFRAIKQTCPETIFHGTDVGHQFQSTGARYLAYLEENGLTDSEEYQRTLEAIEQGKTFYAVHNGDHVYREITMTDNFIREYESLNGESVMGIYGAAHTDVDALDYTKSIDCMAKQLRTIYDDLVISVDLR